MEPTTIQEKARALRNAYLRKWFAANPGKHSEYQRKYWIKKAQREILNNPEPLENQTVS